MLPPPAARGRSSSQTLRNRDLDIPASGQRVDEGDLLYASAMASLQGEHDRAGRHQASIVTYVAPLSVEARRFRVVRSPGFAAFWSWTALNANGAETSTRRAGRRPRAEPSVRTRDPLPRAASLAQAPPRIEPIEHTLVLFYSLSSRSLTYCCLYCENCALLMKYGSRPQYLTLCFTTADRVFADRAIRSQPHSPVRCQGSGLPGCRGDTHRQEASVFLGARRR